MKRLHAMPFGSRLLSGGGAAFDLWAPAAKDVQLWSQPSADGPPRTVPAAPSPNGWWHANLQDAKVGMPYRWVIDGELTVPDPASRSNPGGPHEPSVLTDPGAYAWQTPWRGRPWEQLVFYELHVGTFTTEGTYDSARRKLPELAALGFTAVELMPLSTFAGEWGWGYDGVLPFAPHPAYGSPDALKQFVDDAHSLGLCVFLDVVYNHFGPDGNYLHAYAPGFFSNRHSSPWGAAINFDQDGSEVVREFFIENALYWIEEFNMDGLRLDAVHAIADDSRPDILQQLSTRVRGLASDSDRYVHLVLENEKNQPARLAQAPLAGQYDAQWNDDFHHAVHVALTAESNGYYAKFSDEPLALLARVLTHGFAFNDGASKPGGSPVPLGCMINFIGNHDQIGNRAFGERIGELAPAPAVELAFLLSLLTPATPMVFMGDEFAATTPFLYFANWNGELGRAVREGRMREFSHATTLGKVLPDPCDSGTPLASQLRWEEAASGAGEARRALLKDALRARREWLAPRAQLLCADGHTAERLGASGMRVTWRYNDGAAVVLDMNLGPAPVTVGREQQAPAASDVQEIFSLRWVADVQIWQAWSARWWLLKGER